MFSPGQCDTVVFSAGLEICFLRVCVKMLQVRVRRYSKQSERRVRAEFESTVSLEMGIGGKEEFVCEIKLWDCCGSAD